MSTQTVRGKIKSAPFAVLQTKGVDESTGMLRIEGLASTPNMDRMHEVVETGAFKSTMKQFMANPQMLYMHNTKEPVGYWDSYEIRDEGLWMSGVVGHDFHPADRARRQIEQDVLRALSVGFREIDGKVKTVKDSDGNAHEVYHITDLELLEVSLVSVPANREALFHVSDGKLCDIEILDDETEHKVSDDELRKMCEERGFSVTLLALPYERLPIQSKDAEWNVEKAREALEKVAQLEDNDFSYEIYSKGFAWFDIEASESRSFGYKLPHHNVSEGGIVTNLRGCRACLSAVAGVRGGVEIPDKERVNVYAHLAKHIQDDFGEEVPSLDEAQKLLRENDESLLQRLQVSAEDVDSIIDDSEMDVDNSADVLLDEIQDLVADSVQEILCADTANGVTVYNPCGESIGHGRIDTSTGKFFFQPQAGGDGYEKACELEKKLVEAQERIAALEERSKRVESALVKILKIQFNAEKSRQSN